MNMIFMVFNILPVDIELGILAGLAVAISGYLQAYSKKDKDGKREAFSIDKFSTTVLIGAIAGGIMAYLSIFDGALTIFLTSAGIVAIVDSLIKTFLRASK